MPRPVSRDLIAIQDNVPNMDQKDEVQFRKFTVASAWDKLRTVRPIVDWYRLIWHKDYIPRYSFILLIVCKDKLS